MTGYHLVIVVTVVTLPVLIVLFGNRLLGRVQSVVLPLTILLLLAIDWAAFHDIAEGTEANYTMEYSILAASLTGFAFPAHRWITRQRKPV